MKKIFTLCVTIFLSSIVMAKENKFGEYGYIDSMSYPIGQCFNNISSVDDVIDGYTVSITFNEVKLKGRKSISKDRCAVFVFKDAILGAGQDYYGHDHSTTWYISNDGIHMHGVNAIYTAAMQYALSKVEHKKVLFLHDVPGSVDDAVNLQTIEVVRKQSYSTVLPKGASVASGGADFFLAGVKRSVEGDFKYGVHSWGNPDYQGSDLPKNHPEHNMFLDVYKFLRISEDFYWYTLQAAPSDEMHFMSKKEMHNFGLINASYKASLHQ